MKNKLEQLISSSIDVGGAIDFVQGGGGNTSLKLSHNLMAIKTSGIRLTDMSMSSGYTLVDFPSISEQLTPSLSEDAYSSLLTENIIPKDGFATGKPSMETGFHTILANSVIHTHSVYCNVLTCAENGYERLSDLFSDSPFEWCWIPYCNPGLQLTLEIKRQLQETPTLSVFFLENHGIIVTGDNPSEALKLHQIINETVRSTLELPAMQLSYDLSPTRSDHNGEDITSYSMTSSFSKDTNFIQSHVLFPDQAIYLSDGFNLQNGTCTFTANTKKAAYMAETFLAYDYILTQQEQQGLTPRYINLQKIEEVAALPSEEYRKGLLK